MSSEFEAALEICSVLNTIDQNLDRLHEAMPSQRERIATAALQGLMSTYTPGGGPPSEEDVKRLAAHAAKRAFVFADAMVAELKKEPRP